MMLRAEMLLAVVLFCAACGDDGGTDGGRDSGGADAARDSGSPTDAGRDAGSDGAVDAGSDAGGDDAGGTDGGGTDGGGTDADVDAGGSDAGEPDAGAGDAGSDAGTPDGGMCLARFEICDLGMDGCCPGTRCTPAPPPLGATCFCLSDPGADCAASVTPCCAGTTCMVGPSGRGSCVPGVGAGECDFESPGCDTMCLRAVFCVMECGGPRTSCGCCSCAPGSIDDFICPPGGTE